MHIQAIDVQQYRKLQRIRLDELRKVNVFVGNNNSGKTSLLEAIQLLSNPHSAIDFRQIALQRERHTNYRTAADVPEAIQWMFTQGRHHSSDPIQLAIEMEDRSEYEWQLEEKEYMVIRKDDDDMGDYYEILEERVEREQRVQVYRNDQPIEHYVYGRQEVTREDRDALHSNSLFPSRFVSAVDYKVMALSIRMLSRAMREGRLSPVLEALRTFDSNIEDLKIIPNENNRNTVYVQHATYGIAPVMTFGDGMRKVLYLALAIMEAEGGVLLVDELEIGIHTSILSDTLRWIVEFCGKYDVQLFATTHSLEAVDSIIEACQQQLDELTMFRLEEENVKRVEGKTLHMIRNEFGLDVR